MLPRVTTVADLSTPALVVDTTALARNLDTMSAALPGARLRPHVKAHKCTALAREQARRGHTHFTAATPTEIVGLARAGLGDDLLLANEMRRPGPPAGARRLSRPGSPSRSTATQPSTRPRRTASTSVLIDVNVYLPRCGCRPDDAPRLADRARAAGTRGPRGHGLRGPRGR